MNPIFFLAESNINSTIDAHYYSLQNETISDTLLDKFSNMTTTPNNLNDRIITRITIIKDSQSSKFEHCKQEHMQHYHNLQSLIGYKQDGGSALGISVVQGSDNNVYVKDLMKNGPGERHGVLIGDQVSFEINNWHLRFGRFFFCIL